MKDKNLIYCDIIEENIRVVLERMLRDIMRITDLMQLNDDFSDEQLEDFLKLYEKIRRRYDEK
jgi:prephenate dehydrogenase